MCYTTKIQAILKELSNGLYEREEAIKLTLLAFLSGKSAFLYGPPGTAKSLLAKRVSMAFAKSADSKECAFFTYLMNQSSTPEEIFGPTNAAKNKQNQSTINTQGYLPTAHFAFLDEIWRSSSVILNALLTLMNDTSDMAVPLQGLVCASNEFPISAQGVEALYDRLTIRLVVQPMQKRESFEGLLQNDNKAPNISNPFYVDELKDIEKKAKGVRFSNEALEAMHCLKANLASYNKSLWQQSSQNSSQEGIKDSSDTIQNEVQEAQSVGIQNDKEARNENKADSQEIAQNGIYISDRRWKSMAELLQYAAILSDREEVLPLDIMLLQHCLWNDELHRGVIGKLIATSIHSSIKFSFQDSDLYNLKDMYARLYDAVVSEFYEEGSPKLIGIIAKEPYKNQCGDLLKAAKAFHKEIEQKVEDIANTMQNSFLSTDDYKLALANIQKNRTEIRQTRFAIEQLVAIIQNQPTPIPPKYSESKEAPQEAEVSSLEPKKYKPKNKAELKKLVHDDSIHLGDIDTSLIKNMSELFKESVRTDFSGIESWDTSSVTDMSGMFMGARSFNHNINDWNVENVEDMQEMFKEADSFNQPLDKWNVSKVKSMNGMFFSAINFNQPLDKWNVSKVQNIGYMFFNAGKFNQDLESWIVTRKTNINYIFQSSALKKIPSWYQLRFQ